MFEELEIVGKRALNSLKKCMITLLAASVSLAAIVVFSLFLPAPFDSKLVLIYSLLALLTVIPVAGIFLIFLAVRKLFIVYSGILLQRSGELLQREGRAEEVANEAKPPRPALITATSASLQPQRKTQLSRDSPENSLVRKIEKKCPYCGRLLPYGDIHVVCPYCGRRLK